MSPAALLLFCAGAFAAGQKVDVAAHLQTRPDLAKLHAGYQAALSTRPTLREAEQEYWALRELPRFAALDDAFDEALNADPVAQSLFLQFYDGLHRDGSVRTAFEQMHYAAMEEEKRGHDMSAALLDWQANPEAALRFFNAPEGAASLPDSVDELLPYLRRRPELMGELGGLFEDTVASTQFDERIAPWWKHVEPFDKKHGGVFQALTSYFIARPAEFRAWHRRNLLLAGEAQLRSWILYWDRMVRRDPVLRVAYGPGFVRGTLSGENLQAANPKEAASVWPPPEAPPALASLKIAVPASDAPMKTAKPGHLQRAPRGGMQKPVVTRPEVNRPAMPGKPAMPDRPIKPERSESIPRPSLQSGGRE
ncbi:MAG: hypothetical protein HYV27_13215 [Candidatus Hydrogenedentes bacterium]|nr:hypothetical protein [Candidatus Hydrogenedentota bacterium]